MRLRIGIIGCGTAGQAASILLARQGHEVEVFERAPRVEAVGAGLLVQPTGMSVLRSLGVADELAEQERIFLVPLAKGVRVAFCSIPTHQIHGLAARIAQRFRS